jgi:NAD(P)H dehydrogenase (quinone)
MTKDKAATAPLHHYILLANPSPNSFCHAIAETYAAEVTAQGQTSDIRDLNLMGFDPVLKDEFRPDRIKHISPWVEGELASLAQSAVVVLVYPIWFGGAPAILKGYIDCVLGAGSEVAHFQDGSGQPALRGKWLLTFTTSATPLPWLEERGQRRAMREGWDVYLERGFGMRDAGHVSIDQVVRNMSQHYATEQLDRVRETARETCQRLEPVAEDADRSVVDR